MICDAYYSLAREYDDLLGDLAESTWRSGILTELARLGAGRDQVITDREPLPADRHRPLRAHAQQSRAVL
jgi:hypothetical protein